VTFEKLIYRSVLGTRDQTKLSVTYTRGRLPAPFHPSVLGCSLKTALLRQIPSNWLFTSRLIEVFAFFLARVSGGRTNGAPTTFSNFKLPQQSPLNYLIETTLHNSKAKFGTAHKSLIPSVLAYYEPPVKHNSSEYSFRNFCSDFPFIGWDIMRLGFHWVRFQYFPR